MGLVERIRTLFRLFVLFTVLVAVALISAITTIRLTIHSGQETMPNLVGMPLDQAGRIASRMGLGIKVEDRLFNDKYAANQVISQIPVAGESTKAGQDVHLLVSLGPPHVVVPNLIGASVRAAQITAVQRGLALGDIARVYSSDAPADQVVVQDPPPSTPEVRSPAVNLLVSLGKSPPAFLCPNFVGMRIDSVSRAIKKAGFKLGQVKTVPAPPAPAASATPPAPTGGTSIAPSAQSAPPYRTVTAPSGTILSQSPPPGSKIGPDSAFDFEVAE